MQHTGAGPLLLRWVSPARRRIHLRGDAGHHARRLEDLGVSVVTRPSIRPLANGSPIGAGVASRERIRSAITIAVRRGARRTRAPNPRRACLPRARRGSLLQPTIRQGVRHRTWPGHRTRVGADRDRPDPYRSRSRWLAFVPRVAASPSIRLCRSEGERRAAERGIT